MRSALLRPVLISSLALYLLILYCQWSNLVIINEKDWTNFFIIFCFLDWSQNALKRDVDGNRWKDKKVQKIYRFKLSMSRIGVNWLSWLIPNSQWDLNQVSLEQDQWVPKVLISVWGWIRVTSSFVSIEFIHVLSM